MRLFWRTYFFLNTTLTNILYINTFINSNSSIEKSLIGIRLPYLKSYIPMKCLPNLCFLSKVLEEIGEAPDFRPVQCVFVWLNGHCNASTAYNYFTGIYALTNLRRCNTRKKKAISACTLKIDLGRGPKKYHAQCAHSFFIWQRAIDFFFKTHFIFL